MSVCFHCVDRSASGLRDDSLGPLISCVARYQLGVGGVGVLVTLTLKADVPSLPIRL